jgi:hypothetical protein
MPPIPKKTPPLLVEKMITRLTGGHKFVFVVMPYSDAHQSLYLYLKGRIEREIGFRCFRADDLKASGQELLRKVHEMIDRSFMVVAILTNRRPNVFYEVGYAMAKGKSVTMLVEKSEQNDVATDLRGREVIPYTVPEEGAFSFESDPVEHVRWVSRSLYQVPLVRNMLVAEQPAPCFVVASPKIRPATDTEVGQLPEERTFGDNLGILGLSTALGSALGEGAGLELIPAQNYFPGLEHRPLNLYLIGSARVNPLGGAMLHKLQAGRVPDFVIRPYKRPLSDKKARMELSRIIGGRREWVIGEMRRRKRDGVLVPCVDYGIIVRGPHPDHPKHIVMVLAGAHSLGTGAACLAATRYNLIESLSQKLPFGVLLDRTKTVWALVRGELSDASGFLDPADVEILEAGVYE